VAKYSGEGYIAREQRAKVRCSFVFMAYPRFFPPYPNPGIASWIMSRVLFLESGAGAFFIVLRRETG